MGIDPGLANLGIGVVDLHPGRSLLVHSQTLYTAPSDGPIEARLRLLIRPLLQVALHYRPVAVGIEEQASVGHAKDDKGDGRRWTASYARDVSIACFAALEAIGIVCWFVRVQSWRVAFLGKGSAGAQPYQVKARVQHMQRAQGADVQSLSEHACEAIGCAVGGATAHLKRRVSG